MKTGFFTKVFGSLAIAAIFCGSLVFAMDKPRKKAAPKVPSRLVSSLPSSDAIAVISVKRFFDEMLPSMLANEQSLLGQITSTLNEIDEKTGIRLRQFDEVAVGVSYRQAADGKTSYEPIVIAGGEFDRTAIESALRMAPAEKVEKRTISGREVFVIRAETSKLKQAATNGTESAKKAVDFATSAIDSEMAVAIIDGRTIAAGTLASVERTLMSPVKPSVAMMEILGKRSGSVVSFAMSKPPALTQLIPADLDDLGQRVASIEMFSGSMDPVGTGMQLNLSARTTSVKNASDLRKTLVDMQGLGKGLFGRSKRPDQQMYARFLNNVQFNSIGKEVSISLAMEREDMARLIGMLLK